MEIIKSEKSLLADTMFHYGCCPACGGDGCTECENSGQILLPCPCPYKNCSAGFETMEELNHHIEEVHQVTSVSEVSKAAH